MNKECLLVLIFMFFSSCDDSAVETTTFDYTDLITSITNDVIIQTYTNLNTKAKALTTAVETLNNERTQINLVSVKEAWIATRRPWEQSEGFIFGPVETLGLDPSMDSWPVNQEDLENVIESTDELSKSYVANLEGTLKGFHTIEFLLWGSESAKIISDFDEREYKYLLAATQVLEDDTHSLLNEWIEEGEDFGRNFITAGEAISIYISQKSVLEELTEGIVNIADEVGNGKINDPLVGQDFSLEESQFSDNSKLDFIDNIYSIKNIYEGISNDAGLSRIVIPKNQELDQNIKDAIKNAIDAIDAIPSTFTEAIPSSSPSHSKALEAQKEVRILFTLLSEELNPLISDL